MQDPNTNENIINQSVTEISPGENVLCTVYQHMFGIISIYIMSMVGLIAMLFLTRFLFPSATTQGSDSYNLFIMATFVIVLLVVVILLLATVVYRKTKLTVTDKNIIYVQQKGLLFKKVTCLGLDDVEEVSSIKQGIFGNMFNFGSIKVETAGEQIDLIFNYCGAPDKITKVIYDAKERFNAKNRSNPVSTP